MKHLQQMFKNKISCDYFCLPSQNSETNDKTQNIVKKEGKKLNEKQLSIILPASSSPPISPSSPSPTSAKQNLLNDFMKKIEKKIETKKVEKKKSSATVKKKLEQKKKQQKVGKKKKTEIIADSKKKEKKIDFQEGKQKITNRALKKFEKEFLPIHSPSGQNRLKKLRDKKSK